MYETDHPKLAEGTGSDSLDIIKHVEAAFGIELTDEECQRMVTVGDLFFAVLDKLGPNPAEGCVSQAAFHRVRQVLMDHYGVARKAVRLGANLFELIPALEPAWTRRREWKAFRDRLDCYLPDLQLSNFDFALLFSVSLLGVILACWHLPFQEKWSLYLVSPFLAFFLLAVCCNALLRIAPSRFIILPKECLTVDGLVRTITKRNYAAIARRKGFWNKSEIWWILTEIIIDKTDVKPEEICGETRWGEDLKID